MNAPATTTTTTHRVLHADARDLRDLADASVHCVVTSPPYPMIEMWDEVFAGMNPEIGQALERGDGSAAFDLMHRELEKVWTHCHRALTPGGLACINVGDATRSLGGDFCLYPNHARILQDMHRIGFTPLPDILWRKPTNAPNKFMGSGMLPCGAYVTYEHEHILIFRKGTKREFPSDEAKASRQQSAYFWEERNSWFSDVWTDLVGADQDLGDSASRKRSAAFPFELPYRLILMHTVAGDTVLDPFAGTGTTMAAAAAAARSSIGVEIDGALAGTAGQVLRDALAIGKRRIAERIDAHKAFVEERRKSGRVTKHQNRPYGFPVVTGQEVELELLWPGELQERAPGHYTVEHSAQSPGEASAAQAPAPTQLDLAR